MKFKLLVLMLASAAMSVPGVTLSAHHSFSATYLNDQKMTIEGTLVQFLFRYPHSFVNVEAKDDKGETQRWAIEWGGAGQLGGQGIKRETLKAGDHVIIVGSPGRNPEDHRIRMISLRRPSDGFTWGGRAGETFD
jgi:hypothetical protein